MSRTQINPRRLKSAGTLILDAGGNAAADNWVQATSTGTPAKSAAASAIPSLFSASVQFEQQNPAAGSLINGTWYLHNASGWNFGSADSYFTLIVEFPDRLARWLSGNSSACEMLFGSDAGAGTFTNYKGITLFNGSVTGVNQQGLVPVTFRGTDMTLTGGAVDWTSIKNIRFRVSSNGAAETVRLHGMYLNRRCNPAVLVTMDDGNAEVVAAAAIANPRGIPLTCYLIPDLIGASASYMTEGELEGLVSAGNVMASHQNETFPAYLDTYGEAAMLDYVGSAVSWVNARGWHGYHFAYPGGQFNDRIQAIMRRAGCLSARSIRGQSYVASPERWSAGGSYEGVKSTVNGVPDWYQVMASPLNSGQSLTNAKAALDTAIARGESLIYYGHKIGAVADTVTWTTSDWTALMDYIAQKVSQGLVDAMTIDEYYAAYTGAARPAASR